MTGTGPATQTARLDDRAIVTADGTVLPLTVWAPPPGEKPRAVIVALHGFNDYAHAFALPARFWASRGIATYAYTQRGFGRQSPTRLLWPGTRALVEDAAAAVRLVAARNPGVPLYLLGESMGAAVAINLMAGPDAPAVEGLILVAPAVWGRADIPFPGEWLLDGMAFAMPWNRINAPEGIQVKPTDNAAIMRELRDDPNVAKETRVDALQGLVDLMDEAKRTTAAVRCPTLLLYGLDDQLVRFESVQAIAAALRRATPDFRRVDYTRGYHMLMRDLRGPRAWRDIEAWVRDPRGPLPGDGLD
ncbi:alpha/beta fold hydrolase [Oleomonas cavernae]|uniref:alpha/beta fold hydrolase n=1 Tax=Oleomonas cavernae TaxID=2320859 RepID=UPI0013144BC2|nr:alpha/beta fold hydrolase [Oleomonas cavernae]